MKRMLSILLSGALLLVCTLPAVAAEPSQPDVTYHALGLSTEDTLAGQQWALSNFMAQIM